MMQSDLPNFTSGVQGGEPPRAGKGNCVDRSASCIFCVFYIEIAWYLSIYSIIDCCCCSCS